MYTRFPAIRQNWCLQTEGTSLVESGAKIDVTIGNETLTELALREYQQSISYGYPAAERQERSDILSYLRQNSSRTPPSQVATAPPASSRPSTTSNNYSPPPSSSSGSSSSSSGSGWSDLGRGITESFQSPLDSGTYGLSGTQAKIRLTSIAKSGILSFTNRQGKTVTGWVIMIPTAILFNIQTIIGRS